MRVLPDDGPPLPTRDRPAEPGRVDVDELAVHEVEPFVRPAGAGRVVAGPREADDGPIGVEADVPEAPTPALQGDDGPVAVPEVREVDGLLVAAGVGQEVAVGAERAGPDAVRGHGEPLPDVVIRRLPDIDVALDPRTLIRVERPTLPIDPDASAQDAGQQRLAVGAQRQGFDRALALGAYRRCAGG